MPQNPAELAELFVQVGVAGFVAGAYMIYRGIRRVNPAHLIEGSVTSVSTDSSGNVRVVIAYTDRQGQKQKATGGLDYHPSLGEILPLILPPGKKDPEIHVSNRRGSVIWGVVIILFSAIAVAMGLIYKSRL